MKSARITVVCPCFNDGETIEETFSTLDELEPIDIVVIDDGSTDELTVEALSRLEKDSRVRLVRHPKNLGVAAGINRGLKEAQTEFVFFMGSDDHFVSGALGALADALEQDPVAVAAWGHYEFFEERTGICRVPPWDPWLLTYNNHWPGVALVRTKELMNLGGANYDRLYEDWDMWLRIADANLHGIVVDRIVFRYRIRYKFRRSNIAKNAFADEYRQMIREYPGLIARRGEYARSSPLSLTKRTWLRIQVRINRLLPVPARNAALRLRAYIDMWRQQSRT